MATRLVKHRPKESPFGIKHLRNSDLLQPARKSTKHENARATKDTKARKHETRLPDRSAGRGPGSRFPRQLTREPRDLDHRCRPGRPATYNGWICRFEKCSSSAPVPPDWRLRSPVR